MIPVALTVSQQFIAVETFNKDGGVVAEWQCIPQSGNQFACDTASLKFITHTCDKWDYHRVVSCTKNATVSLCVFYFHYFSLCIPGCPWPCAILLPQPVKWIAGLTLCLALLLVFKCRYSHVIFTYHQNHFLSLLLVIVKTISILVVFGGIQDLAL